MVNTGRKKLILHRDKDIAGTDVKTLGDREQKGNILAHDQIVRN